MNITLIQCPSWSTMEPPYAPALLASCLKHEGHHVYCLDLNIKFYNYVNGIEKDEGWGPGGGSNLWREKDYVIRLIKRHGNLINAWVSRILDTDAFIIGFTVQDTSRVFSEEIARLLKEKCKSKIVVFGGPSCFRNSSFNLRFLENDYVDVVCFQEGELALLDLVRRIENTGEVGFCQGFAYKDNSGKFINCGERELIGNLESIPFADFSDFNLDEYESKALPISTSRGCLYRCVFCSEATVWGRYRFRGAQNIYNEMVYQTKKYPQVESFFFNDSLINGNIRMLDELADLIIKSGFNIKWGGQGKIREEMTLKLLKKLHKAGFCHVSYGLESGSQGILNLMEKKLSLHTAEEVIRNTHKAGIHITVNIIVGFPMETEKEVFETAEFLKRNRDFVDEIYFHPLALMPHSPLYEYKERFCIELPQNNGINLWSTRDGRNNYHIRLERIEFYKNVLKDKFASNISMFNYYYNLAEYYCGIKDFRMALGCCLKAEESTEDITKINLTQELISSCRNSLEILTR